MQPNRQNIDTEHREDERLAVLAHELRSPLAALNNAAELLSQVSQGDPSLERIGAIITRQTAAMRVLVEQVLDLNRLDAERIPMSLRRLDLREVARNTVEDHRAQIEHAGLRCEMAFPEEPLHVRGDATRLAQVLGNLLQNAVKFTPPPGSIRVDIGAADGRVCLSVRDTGEGIPPQFLPMVFDRYRQATCGGHGGLGLGLPIAKGLIEQHGGTIEAESDGVGRGCTINVRLPLAKEDA